MNKHTPGPWYVTTDLDNLGEDWKVATSGAYFIEGNDQQNMTTSRRVAVTTNGAYFIMHDRLKSDEMGDPLADARLIAAAPTLLAACQSVLADAKIRPGAYLYANINALYSAMRAATNGTEDDEK